LIEIAALASSSRGNAYRVTDGVTPLLLECGLPFAELRKRLGFGVSGLAACLVSHEHADHSRAVRDLAKAGVDVYASKGTMDALGVLGHRMHVVEARRQFALGSWTVLPFDTVHDAAEPLGFLMATRAGEKLLYVTDTAYLRYRFKRLTHIMVECNYSLDIARANVQTGALNVEVKNRLVRSHFSLENVKEFLRANDLGRVKEIWLLHLSDANSDAERFRREIIEVTGKPVIVAEA